MTYDVITIADEMLKIAKRAGKALTPLQLMKLVYIAHGWSLGLKRGDLFAERIEAWRYGPVIPDLYYATKHYGREPIPFDRIESEYDVVDEGTQKFLEDVFAKYGNFSGVQLSNLTHRSGSPWDVIYGSGEYNAEIPDALIASHYEALLNERERSPVPA